MIKLIDPKQICNLGRLPISILQNPMKKTCSQIINNPKILASQAELHKFYHKVKFNNLGSLYDIDVPKEQTSFWNEPVGLIFQPWIHHWPLTRHFDFYFLRQISDKEISIKVQKLKDLVLSIQKKDQTERFYVVSGNHRVAVLAALFPDKPIPVILEREDFMKPRDKENRGSFKTTYSLDNVDLWPAVKSRCVTIEQAKKIINKYLEA